MDHVSKSIIEIIAALTILVSVVGVLWHRLRDPDWGLSLRAMQFLAVATMPGLLLILSLEELLEKGAVAAIVGAFIGYILSGIATEDRRGKGD
jgi:hypothetical protein